MMFATKLRVGLKELQVTMEYKNVQEYDGDFNARVPLEDFDKVIKYNINDIESTTELMNHLEPDIRLREAVNQVYLLTGGNEGYSRKEVMNKFITFYPDEGAMKRYSSLLDFPYAFGIKKRDWETGNILGLEVMNKEIVKDKNILIIDDICSKGGTFYYAAKALKELGAHSIYLYVTHCEKTITSGNIYYGNEIAQIFTTNSIWRDENDPRVKILED